jgi:hypothetical protein
MVSLLPATESNFLIFLQVRNRRYFQFLVTVILTVSLHTHDNNLVEFRKFFEEFLAETS